MPGHIHDICSRHCNRTTVHIIKAHQQINQRSLAASGRSHDCHTLSLLYFQIEVFDQFLLRYIRKIHMRQGYPSVELLYGNRIICIRYLWLFFYQIKNPGCTGQRILKFCDHSRYLIERFGVLVGIAQKTG